jgi:hypothetical protein
MVAEVVELEEIMELEAEDCDIEGDKEDRTEEATGDDDGRIEMVDDSTTLLGLELTEDTTLSVEEEADCFSSQSRHHIWEGGTRTCTTDEMTELLI